MKNVIGAIGSYLLFNIAIWLAIGHGGLLALAGANAIGGLLALGFFWRSQVSGRGSPKWMQSLLGAVGVFLIVFGLRQAHAALPVSLSMEAVYNGFAIASWPLFLVLGQQWPQQFTDKPNRFDLVCHGAMACLVVTRFATYGDDLQFSVGSMDAITVAISGYALFNISIKLARGHRATNVVMNFMAAGLLATYAVVSGDAGQWTWDASHLGGAALGCVAIFGIVHQLGSAYAFFGARKQGSLVAPLVYDGILVASPFMMVITGEHVQLWTIVLAAGMLTVTIVRYRHHAR